MIRIRDATVDLGFISLSHQWSYFNGNSKIRMIFFIKNSLFWVFHGRNGSVFIFIFISYGALKSSNIVNVFCSLFGDHFLRPVTFIISPSLPNTLFYPLSFPLVLPRRASLPIAACLPNHLFYSYGVVVNLSPTSNVTSALTLSRRQKWADTTMAMRTRDIFIEL